MTRDFVEKYYLKGDYNCAETLLLAANDAYGLGFAGGGAQARERLRRRHGV